MTHTTSAYFTLISTQFATLHPNHCSFVSVDRLPTKGNYEKKHTHTKPLHHFTKGDVGAFLKCDYTKSA